MQNHLYSYAFPPSFWRRPESLFQYIENLSDPGPRQDDDKLKITLELTQIIKDNITDLYMIIIFTGHLEIDHG